MFVAVGGMIAPGAWQIFRGALRTSAATDRVVDGMAANLLLSLRLDRDLAALHEDDAHPIRFEVVADQEATLSFYRHAPGAGPRGWEALEVLEVRYRFDSRVKRIFRAQAGGEERMLPGLFERMHVRLLGGGEEEGPRVLVTAVSTPREWLRRPLEERPAHVRSTLGTTAVREDRVGERSYPFWNPVPRRVAATR